MVARPFNAGIAAPIMRCVAERQLIPELPIDANITSVIYFAACDSDIIDDREGDKDASSPEFVGNFWSRQLPKCVK